MTEAMILERLEALEQAAQRQEIIECQTRAFRGVDRGDWDIFRSAFHPDALIDLFGAVHTVEELFALIEDVMKVVQLGLHYMTNHTCEIDGDVAHTETYMLFSARNLDKTHRMSGGRVLERLERREGQWKIAFRYVIIEWSGTLNPSGARPDIPDLYLNGAPSRSRDDVSYLRPLINRREKSSVA